jgi:AraC-like DNA-binding protein
MGIKDLTFTENKLIADESRKYKSSKNIIENKLQINDQFVDTSLNEIYLGDVRIYHANHTQKKKRLIPFNDEFPPIQMHFLLKGQRSVISKETGKIYRMTENQHNLFYVPPSDWNYTLESDNVTMFMVQFTEDFFYNFIDENSRLLSQFWNKVIKKEESPLSMEHDFNITPKVSNIISQIINSDLKGNLMRLFIEAKINELFISLIKQAEYIPKSTLFTLKNRDKENLYALKEFLDKNIFKEFSLGELSREAGMNEFKLKKGFKELFNTTVFGYINDIRMEHAKYLLLEGGRDVSEVSDILGYSLPHHFAKAFKRKFGYQPSKLKSSF